MSTEPCIAVIGLGYVGAPLLAAFAARHPVIGFDTDATRLDALRAERDVTGELRAAELHRFAGLTLTDNPSDLADANVYIVTVPTPVDDANQPDLSTLRAACRAVGATLTPGDTVVFESTVYPGATEEVCVPLLEQVSGLKAPGDFWYGYSPERINPGDPKKRLQDILKITSGCSEEATEFIDGLYAGIITAGTCRVSSVRVAEAAKVIENTQRDVNIALVNELAMLFDRLGLDTQEVLEAAGTKWNFLAFQPGLVGGHCIGVDPYYLTHKARNVGFEPRMILAGRSINDGMADFVARKVLELVTRSGIAVSSARILVMGLTFKENTPDTRNSQVFRLIDRFSESGCQVDVMDPWVEQRSVKGLTWVSEPTAGTYDSIVIAVPHAQFAQWSEQDIRAWGTDECVIYDVKNLLGAGSNVYRL